MRQEFLNKLITAKTEKRPTVVVTDLALSTVTWLEGEYGDIAMTPGLSDGIDRTLRRDKGETVEETKFDIFSVPPPKRMIVVGAAHCAIACPMATLSGYDVTIVDPRQVSRQKHAFPA